MILLEEQHFEKYAMSVWNDGKMCIGNYEKKSVYEKNIGGQWIRERFLKIKRENWMCERLDSSKLWAN